MGHKKTAKNLTRELNKLEKEIKKDEKENERYKDSVAKEFKNFDKNKIFNSKPVEKKYTIWERIMKSLGMN